MDDAVIRLGNYSLYGFGLLATISFLWGAFVFYKKAIASHLEESHILDSVVIAAFWSFIVGRLFYVVFNWQVFWDHLPRIFLFSNFPGMDRWGALAGIFLGVYLTVRKIKGKVIDWYDLTCLGIIAGASIFYAGLSLIAASWRYGLVSCLFLVLFFIFWRVEENYRKYVWYKANKTSAKSGLILGSTVFSLGVIYAIETWLHGEGGIINVTWSLALFVGGLVLVYIRSGRTAAEDIKIIVKKYGRKK